jgi:hypothetical protein
MSQQKQGILISWKPLKGFGSVAVSRHEVYFLHTTKVVKGPETPAVGSVVYFDVAPAREGGQHPQAVNAVIVDEGGAQ